MHHNKHNTLASRIRSFGFALAGMRALVKAEPNAKLHLVATIAVIALGIYRHLDSTRWAAVIVAIGLVWITEAINTALEHLCDYACKGELHPTIKVAKDVSAAAVLFAAITAAGIAVVVFLC